MKHLVTHQYSNIINCGINHECIMTTIQYFNSCGAVCFADGHCEPIRSYEIVNSVYIKFDTHFDTYIWDRNTCMFYKCIHLDDRYGDVNEEYMITNVVEAYLIFD